MEAEMIFWNTREKQIAEQTRLELDKTNQAAATGMASQHLTLRAKRP
jgi:hypothetical protein